MYKVQYIAWLDVCLWTLLNRERHLHRFLHNLDAQNLSVATSELSWSNDRGFLKGSGEWVCVWGAGPRTISDPCVQRWVGSARLGRGKINVFFNPGQPSWRVPEIPLMAGNVSFGVFFVYCCLAHVPQR